MNKKITLIIADDTTGANASGILLNTLGLTVLNAIQNKGDTLCDVLTVGTESRAISPSLAYKKVFEQLVAYNEPFMIYNKRIDSTLRGNIGIELQAFFDYSNKNAKQLLCHHFLIRIEYVLRENCTLTMYYLRTRKLLKIQRCL